jgi:large subunit ribosomal protein L14
MLHSFSWFRVADSSGATFAKCIRIYKKGRTEHGVIGDLVSVVPKKIFAVGRKKLKIKAGAIFKGLLIRQKSTLLRFSGQWRSYADNAVILFGTGPSYAKAGVYTPLSKRVFGSTSLELRRKGFSKIVSLSRRIT